nr:hypothetical protein [Tanacetum cinerariifolium]
MENRGVFSDGEALRREVSQRMKSLIGKVYSEFGAHSHMNSRGALNPNLGSLNSKMRTVHCESNKADFTSTPIITSLGEATNPSLSTMNPNSTYGADDDEFWATSTNANESVANVNHIHNIDDVANIFGVSLNSLKENEEFVKDLSLDCSKEELTRIPIWVKLHDVPIQVFEDDGISLIVTFIGVPSLTGEDFTKKTIRVEYEWRLPRCDICKIFGHVHDQCPKKKKRKDKPKSTNCGQFVGPVVKQNVRYEPKANTSVPKQGATKLGDASTSSSMSKNTDNSSNIDNITSLQWLCIDASCSGSEFLPMTVYILGRVLLPFYWVSDRKLWLQLLVGGCMMKNWKFYAGYETQMLITGASLVL